MSQSLAIMKKGNCNEIVDILSTAKRDFLIRNNGDQVKIESLRGKTICIYFLFSPTEYEYQKLYMHLGDVYDELSPKGEFEVVVVAANRNREIDLTQKKRRKRNIEVGGEELFNTIFSGMPWLSIPYGDVKTRIHLCNLFSMSSLWESDYIILDPAGKVVSEAGSEILEEYGAEGYPFTAERIREIRKEDARLRRNLCLKTLLGSSTSDFLINNKEDKVPISRLKGNVVGLYMYNGDPRIEKSIHAAYKKLKKKEYKFEIVLVNLHFNRGCSDIKSFWQNFKKMPWLALPFMDKRCRKLSRIFDHPCDVVYSDEGILLIFGPDGYFVETYGYTILKAYGIKAYPFTEEKVVEIETKRRKKVTLDRLFATANNDYVITTDGTEIPISDLKGKNILLFFPDCESKDICKVLPKLKEWYYEIRGKDAAFEIIYVSSIDHQLSFYKFFLEMPWLAFPCEIRIWSIFHEILGNSFSQLVAFGTDGHLVTNKALPLLQDHGVDAYPFVEDEVPKEILEELELTLNLV